MIHWISNDSVIHPLQQKLHTEYKIRTVLHHQDYSLPGIAKFHVKLNGKTEWPVV